MVDACAAGVGVEEFYRLTVGEIVVAIDGHQEREKQTLISRVNSVLRGLSTLGKKKSDPYHGLGVGGKREATQADFRRANDQWLWRKD